jgi:uncharacterized repeat protein (TIGR01451 family)
MRRTYWLTLSTVLLLALMMALLFNAAGVQALAPILDENFDYGGTAGNLTAVSGGNWTAHSGAGLTPVQYVITSLSMPSYASSGVAGSATFASGGSREDVNRLFTDQGSGTLYYAALVNISQASTTGDYVLHFKNSSTGFAARLFARDSGGALQFGIGTSSTPSWGTTNFAYNTTYLAVAKYNMGTYYSTLYVLDSCVSTEPGTPLAEATSATPPSLPLVAIAIRQGSNVVVGTVDGIRVATTWAEAAQCVQSGPELSLAKSATPNTNVEYHGEVTYTLTLTNTGGADDAGAFLTDTLPSQVDFARWIVQPTGAAVSADEITWSGTVTASTAISFTFVVTHVGDYGDAVTNTAEFSGTNNAGTAEAVFTVAGVNADVTFVYHDLEDVVRPGDQLYLAGDFNGWSTTATPLTGDGGGTVFQATVSGLTVGTTYQYKYVVKSGGDQWDWLQAGGPAGNRSLTVAGTGTVNDYRNVAVGWAILQWPATLDAEALQPTDPVYGRVYIQNVTDPGGEGRGIKAEVGYGQTATPANWTWFPMAFNVDNGANDEFMGSMIPTASGVYSYAVRFDGNWGSGNPNADWTYGDLDGTVPGGDPFELDQTGVMTSTLYDVAIAKTCPPSPIDPGQTVRYTLSYDVLGGPTEGTVITDVLPVDVVYVTDSSGVTPAQPVPGTLVWSLGTVATSGSFVVTGTVSTNPTEYNLTNQAWVDATNDALPGNNAASCSNTRTGGVSIYDIQYTTEPGPSNYYESPFVGQEVTTTGTVCAVMAKYFIVTEAPGAWHSVIVYNGTQTKPPVGTRVMINGTVLEYYGLTEFSYPLIMSMGAGDPVCATTLVDTSSAPYNDAARSEPLESVMVEYHLATITDNNLTGRNTFTDPGGGTGKWGDYGFFPTAPRPPVGTQYAFLRGPLAYSFYEYRVMPPTASDAPLLDITPPTVVSTDPAAGATGVNPYKPVYATFSEDMDPATLNVSTFLLTGPGGTVAGTIGYDAATFTASFVPSVPLAPYTAYSARLTTDVKDTTGNPLAADYVWTFTTGALDTTPPSIVAQFPAAGALDAPLGTNVIITFSEELNPATVVEANFTLLGPYGLVPWDGLSYDSGLYEITLNPNGLLLPTTRYTVTVDANVTDWAGLPVPAGQRTLSFTTQAEPPMFAYQGDIHNHTSYSDGSGTPAQAFVKGRTCGLEFMAITDHSYAIDDGEWADILAQAETYNVDGEFVTLRGFEYTQGGEGHANVYNSVRHATRALVSGCTYCDYTPNLEKGVTVDGFYHWLSITGTVALDGNGTIMQFNHPGWINFNDWKYHPEVEDMAQLEEVGNGWGSSYVFSWDEWIRSLDYGWQVGATNNTDNHSSEWGCIGPNRTGVVMAALTREDLMEALRSRRVYATEDSNADLFFKANGYWMGSEIPNTGSIAFHAWGSDPDGELTTRVELVTAEGQTIASIQPNASGFDWELTETIAPGVHYYLILVTQADGDRIVSSPVWTQGVEDVRVTDLTIQPSLPTIYNPSLLNARVTNRGATAQTLTISFQANGEVIDTVPVTVQPCTLGPCADAYATIAWQPVVTGPVTVLATIEGAPAGDNLDDNSRSLALEVTDERIPLVLIDTGHNNIGVDPHGISQFVDDMTLHGYNVLFNLDQITASDLSTETVRLLILNAYGPDQLTTDEQQAIAAYVAAGGSVWLNAMSDYNSQVYWAHNVASRMNALVSSIETSTGEQVPIRFNDDEVLDGNNNNGYPWGVLWHNFPVSDTTGVGMNVVQMQSWSDCSLMDRNGGALTEDDLGTNGFMMVLGDMDPGYGTYGEANRTHNTDAEIPGYPTNDAYIYPEGTYLPAGAGYDFTGEAGRILFYTDSNDPFNVFAYVSGDGKQNELFNLEAVMWLLGEPLQKETVAEARYDPELDDTPENLDRLVWVEGTVTAGYGEFFDVLYVQDETGGITVFAPAGTASGAVEPDFNRGDCVRVVGTVDVYQGDTEIQFFETEQIHVLDDQCFPAGDVSISGTLPLPLATYDASLEMNEGWLVVVSGTVTAKSGTDTAWLDDGSGPVRLFLDGYNGTWDDVQVGDRIMVAGMTSEDGFGQRIRVRNHNMHPALPDDVLWLPQIYKQVTPQADVPLGGVVTYTLVLSNNNSVELVEVLLTDVLPAEVDFGGWVLQNGAQVANDIVTWNGMVEPQSEMTIILTATVGTDPAYYGQTVVNVATFQSANGGSSWGQAAFIVEDEPLVPSLAVVKDVTPAADVPLGGVVTYTITLANSGNGAALGVLLTDALPAEVDFGGWVIQPVGAIQAGDMITWTGSVAAEAQVMLVLTATVGTDPGFYGLTVTNTASFVSEAAGSGASAAAFIIEQAPPPSLSIVKDIAPAGDVILGGVVTYTITMANSGEGSATGVTMTDVLPVEVSFGGWLAQPAGAIQANGTVTWTGDIPAAPGQVVLAFTATVGTDPAFVGRTVTNTATFISDNAGSHWDSAAFAIIAAPEPDLNTSTKVSAYPGQRVMPGDLVTYTITLDNTGDGDATASVTDVLGPYYIVYDAMDLTESPAGTLTWSGVVPAGQQVVLHFVAQVVGPADLPVGITFLDNSVLVDDGLRPAFLVSDLTPPWARIYGVYLPMVSRNH